jgi:TonB family protein
MSFLSEGGSKMRDRQASTFLSLTIHVTAAALLLTVTTRPGVISSRPKINEPTILIVPYPAPVAKDPNGGGGGGGKNSILRASQGDLPKAAHRQFTPPAVIHENLQPKLMMEPTIVVASNAPLPMLHIGLPGDPLAPPGPPSDGRGKGGGIGEGNGTGVGPGKGLGYGPGNDHGYGGGDPTGGAGSRGAVTPAALLSKVEPEYSDEARRAKVQGTVLLYLEVDSEGKPRNITVRQGLGLGLDEKAISAVMHWKFRPGKQNGRAITTLAMIEVNFRLL